MTKTVNLAVNGGLMPRMEANHRLIAVNIEFICEDTTEPIYKLFTITVRS